MAIERMALNREEAAERLGISFDSFVRHVQPRVRMVTIGRRVLVPVAELERFLNGPPTERALTFADRAELRLTH